MATDRASSGAKNSFDVLFVGLFCFMKDDRFAVMPDGRTPADDDIQPHEPFLVVDPKHVNAAATTGWQGNAPPLTAQGIYKFSNCEISISTATTPGNLDSDQHHNNIPRAVNIDPSFEYGNDWGSGIIAAIKLGQGKLEFLRRPDRPSNEEGVGTLSRLHVLHDDNVVVTVAVEGEPEPRVLTLNPGSAVAIVNGYLGAPTKHGDGRKLFASIAKTGLFMPVGSPATPNVPVIGANYQLFKIGLHIMVDGMGCCPPP